MLHFTDVAQAQKLCECLAAPARVEILRLILSGRAQCLDTIAKTLHLSNGAITQHVKKLCAAGLITLEETQGKRGIAKRCAIAVDRIMIDVSADAGGDGADVFDVPIGQFSSASVNPYCAIATVEGYIGERDDPRYFTYPDRISAALIYFNSGKIGWTLPAPQKRRTKVSSVSVTFELSSKPSGHGRKRESAVTFYMNDVKLGTHSVDGEFTDRKGLFTPETFDDVCQYGSLKTVKLTENGAFIDGIKLSDASISDIDADNLVFTLAADNGLAIFGKGFGDYDCGLRYKIEYGK